MQIGTRVESIVIVAAMAAILLPSNDSAVKAADDANGLAPAPGRSTAANTARDVPIHECESKGSVVVAERRPNTRKFRDRFSTYALAGAIHMGACARISLVRDHHARPTSRRR